MDNTIERAHKCFDRVSNYAKGDELLATVCYYLGDRITQQMTGEERQKLRACLYSLFVGAKKAGAEAAADVRARAKLEWVLSNWNNLTTEE